MTTTYERLRCSACGRTELTTGHNDAPQFVMVGEAAFCKPCIDDSPVAITLDTVGGLEE